MQDMVSVIFDEIGLGLLLSSQVKILNMIKSIISSASYTQLQWIKLNVIPRAWRETVVTKNLFWGNFDPFVNNAHLGAIAQNEQWHLNVHCLQRKMI